jgi:sugar-specific transcriptional regulator TrmB
MRIQKVIEKLGYRPNSVKAYLAVLQLGEATISEISKKIQLPRTSTQLIVQSLHKDGLLNFYTKVKRKYWVAENPDRLLSQIRARESEIKEILPEIHSLRRDSHTRPVINSFNGIEGVRKMLDDIIETKHPIRSFSSVTDFKKLLGEEFNDFIARRRNRFLHVQFLTSRTQETELLKKRDSQELRNTRFMPDSIAVNNAHFIYGDKLAIISLNKKLPTGVIIHDKTVAMTHKGIFDALWAQSRE